MPEIRFSIDPGTGELQVEVHGVLGPACEEITRLTTEFLGDPAKDLETAEYRLRPRVQPAIRTNGRP